MSTTEAEVEAAHAARIMRCAEIIDVPKPAPANSFVLHAPLELLARALLIERIPAGERSPAYERLERIAEQYEAEGPSADPFPDPADVAPDDLILSLAAAGHAPILTSLRRRVPIVASTFGGRMVAVELAGNPAWRLSWPATRRTDGPSSGDLAERLAAPRRPGDPGSDFIYPTMHLTDASGLAAEVLDEPLRGMAVDEARRILLRVAAESMLQDDPDAAPYQWTHCLTLPQAALVAGEHGADPDLAVAVAATYVLGFRAMKGRVRLSSDWKPAPNTAASRMWSAPADETEAMVAALVANGAAHPDAHLAKYTLACLDATEADPDAGRLFLAAAAHLHEWWSRVPAAN